MRIWSILANISHGIFTRGSSLRSIAYLRSVAVIDGDVYSNVISRPPTKITCLENVSHRYASIFLCASTTRHSCFVLRLDSSPSFLSSSSSFFFFRILELPSWTSIDNVLTVTFLPVSVTISETLYNRNLQNDSRAFFRLSSSFCPHDPSFGSLIVNSSETRVKFREIQITGGCVIARTDATRKWEDGKGPDKHEASRLFEGYGHTRVVT